MISNISRWFLIPLIPLLVIACSLGGLEETQEPAAETPQAVPAVATLLPTAVPTALPTYPAQNICDEMAALLQQQLGFPTEIKSDAFNEPSGLSGAGCTVTASGTGESVTDWGQMNNNLIEALRSQGWVEDYNFSGGGATGLLTTYRREGYVIRYISEVRPADKSVCSQNEPITVCLDKLAPAQRLYSVTISASPDSFVPDDADYPAKIVCNQMSSLAEMNLSLPAEIRRDTFDDPSGLSGEGCTVTTQGTGEAVTDWGQKSQNLYEAIKAEGWVIDYNFSAGGAGGVLEIYRRENYVCRYLSEAGPADPSLCSNDEPLTACMDRLAPAQRLYRVEISCSPDAYKP